MIRPFISSDGRSTTDTVLSTTCSDAIRWMAIEITRRALSLAFSVGLLFDLRTRFAASIRASFSSDLQELLLGLFDGQPGDLFELDPLFGEGGISSSCSRSPRAASCVLRSRLRARPWPARVPRARLDRSSSLVLLFLERLFETDQFEPLIAGLPFEFGARRQQSLARQDFGVFSNPLSPSISARATTFAGPASRHWRPVGAAAPRERRHSTQTNNQSEDRDQQHDHGCYHSKSTIHPLVKERSERPAFRVEQTESQEAKVEAPTSAV